MYCQTQQQASGLGLCSLEEIPRKPHYHYAITLTTSGLAELRMKFWNRRNRQCWDPIISPAFLPPSYTMDKMLEPANVLRAFFLAAASTVDSAYNNVLPSTTDFLSRSCFSMAFPPCDLGTLPTVQGPRLVIPMRKANMPRKQIPQISVRCNLTAWKHYSTILPPIRFRMPISRTST